MNGNLCTRMKRRLKRIGQDEKTACRYAKSFYLWMLSVCGLFGVLDGTPEELYGSGTGAGLIFADARAAGVLSASFGLGHR
jgi:hypothetical protein